jgi:hypothetical protein
MSKSSYLVIVEDKVARQTFSLTTAKKWANEIEEKYRKNCEVVKVMKR